MRTLNLFLIAFLAFTVRAAETNTPLRQVISLVLEQENGLKGIPFPEVVQATTGHQVLPLAMTNEADRQLVSKIASALDRVLQKMNGPESPIRKQRRINEVSSFFEVEMKRQLNEVPGFSCDFAPLKSGKIQRSGYPDLRLEDKAAKRVIYLDPKLYEEGSRSSTFRTFYFEPKTDTGKIHDDAHHLIIGFEHSGKQDGELRFLNWDIVDVSGFRVRLKAEFQGSNKDLYQPELIVGTSRRGR